MEEKGRLGDGTDGFAAKGILRHRLGVRYRGLSAGFGKVIAVVVEA